MLFNQSNNKNTTNTIIKMLSKYKYIMDALNYIEKYYNKIYG